MEVPQQLRFVNHNLKKDSEMHLPTWLATALAIVSVFSMALATEDRASQTEELRELNGDWIFVEDRTEGRALVQLGPPMSSKFSMRVEDGGTAVVLNGHGSGHRDVRIAMDACRVARPTESD